MTSSRQSAQTVPQSRIGKRPVPVPDKVQVTVQGQQLSVKGPKGTLQREIPPAVTVQVKDGTATVTPLAEAGRDGKRIQGLVRSLLAGMIKGVSEGYTATLDLYGVGYRAEVKGRQLNLALGYSHWIHYDLPDNIEASVQTVDQAGVKRPRLQISSHDKELLGRTAARIRSFRPPEPYKGKGIRFLGEHIREKAGKSGAKT